MKCLLFIIFGFLPYTIGDSFLHDHILKYDHHVRCALRAESEDCLWNRDEDFPTYPSLLMNEETWQSYLPVLEGSERVIRIEGGASIIIACPGSTISAIGKDVAEGKCSGGSYVTVDGESYDMKDLGCTSRVSETLASPLKACGNGNKGVSYSIRFDITGYDPYELVYICFEPNLEIAIYTKHILRGASVDATDTNPSRPSFKSSYGIYSVSANTCYEINSQEELMEEILDDSSVIDESASLYFARGHLSPDADFNTEMESDATYYYVNAIPQWQAINNGNWKYLETAIRDLASEHGTDFQIWTGPIDTLELDDSSGDSVSIYLGLYQEEKVIPAPSSVWKVICDLSTNDCVAVIMSNNPYLDSFPKPICTNICDEISWIDFDVKDLTRGATYCCTVKDLHDAVPDAPNISGAGLLKS